MDVFDLLAYKLENVLDIRSCPREFGPLFYKQDEPSLFCVAARKRDGSAVLASRWHDLFSVAAFEKAMAKTGFTEADCHALLLVLSRFGYLLEIDNRRRTDGGHVVFFCLIQLIGLKNGKLDTQARRSSALLRALLFELSIDDETYCRFGIEGGRMVMATDARGVVPFLDVVDLAYAAIRADDRKEQALFRTLKGYQAGLIRLLAEPDAAVHRFGVGEGSGELMYPDVFLRAYAHDRRRIVAALVDALRPSQSAEALFVSDMILMNYCFHVLQDRPEKIVELQRHVDDAPLFGRLRDALSERRMAIGKVLFESAPAGHGVPASEEGRSRLDTLLYGR
ncbi:hypothetical protein [Xanthomonas sp. 1678]|uniref:hypothetical protein n=1 Tax=Xanthomonas sp. 1678 TaxID=3158788 RepID=UPI00286290BD|nr:hypothetical protein [Xanthomonas translucens]